MDNSSVHGKGVSEEQSGESCFDRGNDSLVVSEGEKKKSYVEMVNARVAAERAVAERVAVLEAIDADQAPPPVDPISSNYIRDCIEADDLGLGMLYSAMFEGRFVFCKNNGLWSEFGEHCWRHDLKDNSSIVIEDIVDRLLGEYGVVAGKIQESLAMSQDDIVKSLQRYQSKLFKTIKKLRSSNGRKACLEFAHTCRNSLSVNGDEFDQNPMLLAAKNGVINLETGDFRAGRPADMISKCCNVEWQDFYATAPVWEQALLDIYDGDQELIDYFGRLMGYALTGLNKEHIFPVMQGRGRNGKSLVIETIAWILGDYAAPIPAEMLLDSGRTGNAGSPTPEIMALKGLRLAYASETDEGRRFSPSRIKWLTGGDTLTGRGLHDKNFTKFNPTHTLVLLTNHRPAAPDNDYAFWERAFLLPHKLSFVDRECREPFERPADKDLIEKLRAEGSGILAWLVRHCIAWQVLGLAPPETVTKATAAYRKEEDLLHDFFEDCCVISPTATVKSADLYKAYSGWYRENTGSEKITSQKRFGKLIMDREKFGKRKSSVCWYDGIDINDDWKERIKKDGA